MSDANRISARRKKYRELNREKIAGQQRFSYQKHREKRLTEKAIYYQRNKKSIQLKVSEFQKKNREKINQRVAKYRRKNKEKLLLKIKQRRKSDPQFKLLYLLRARMQQVLARYVKRGRTVNLLGCTTLYFQTWIELQFQDGMSWENHGTDGWHVDHIRPCASFDLTCPRQQQQCFHYTNLQPLWAEDNRRKSDTWKTH